MPVYPYELPPPTLRAYTDSNTDTAKRTEREAGEDRVRPATSRPYAIVSVAWDYSEAQYAIFRRWFNVFVGNGSLEFDVQLSGRSVGDALGFFKARFTGVYEAELQLPGDRWVVSAQLLVTSEEFDRVPDVLLGAILRGSSSVRGALSVPTTLRAIVGGTSTVYARFAGASPVELGAIVSNTTSTVLGVLQTGFILRATLEGESEVLGALQVGAGERTTTDADRRVTTDGDVRITT